MNLLSAATSRRDFLRGLLCGLPVLLAPGLAGAAAVSRWRNKHYLNFITDEMPLIGRSRWNTIRPVASHLNPSGVFYRITVHHAGMEVNYHRNRGSVAQDLLRITAAHHARNYGDIGYHFVIDYGGRLWEGRSLIYEGAHVSGANEGNIGVMLLGNFEKQRPSLAQLDTLEQVVDLLQSHFGIRSTRLYGHCELGPTLCPGHRLYPYVTTLRRG